jgi:hypothetical protein
MKWLVPILIFLASCSDGIPRHEEPADLIPREKMVTLLTELSKLEAYIQVTYVSVDRYHKTMKVSGDSLLKAHDLTYDTFESSLDYYASHQEEMISINNDVLENLNKELGEVQSSK